MNLLTQFMFEVNHKDLPLPTKILLIIFYIFPAIAIGLGLVINLIKGMY